MLCFVQQNEYVKKNEGWENKGCLLTDNYEAVWENAYRWGAAVNLWGKRI